MPNNTIFDSTLFVRLDLDDTRPTNAAFRSNVAGKAQLASSLLLYDRVAIPTYDLGIVPVLSEWFGPDRFIEALNDGVFKFVRRRGMLAYVGNGNSISTILIERGKSSTWQWWQEALFGLSPRSLELQVEEAIQADQRTRRRIIEAASPHVLEHGYDNQLFLRNIVQESYEDIQQTPYLRALVAREVRSQEFELARLPNVGPDQARILHANGIGDSVDLLLRVADVNMELFLAASTDFADIYTINRAQELLGSKLARARVAPATAGGFTKLLTLNGIPDIGTAISRGDLELHEVLGIRHHPDAVAFRRWLQTVAILEPDTMVAAYIRALSSAAKPQSWPLRTLRLALTTTLGVLGAGVGLAASAVDTFFVDKWLTGYSPRLFLDRLASLELPKRS